jgi:hypothetical protein
VDYGALCKTTGKTSAEYKIPVFYPFVNQLGCSMPLYGLELGNGKALAAFVDGGALDFSLLLRTAWGETKRYGLDPVFDIRDHVDEAPLQEDITVHLVPFTGPEANYTGIAKAYRRFNREIRKLPMLREKMKNNPTLEYSSKALCLRCRMGVKQLPTPVLEQTPETQPPFKTFMTFENVKTLVEECARQQTGPIEFCMVGWNYGGHDGAFPQLFPVEGKLGGETKLRQTIERARALGFPMTLHDNYLDAYSLADTFDPDALNVNYDGTKTKISQYAGGQAYQICPQSSYEKYARESLPKVAALGVSGSYYIDEVSLAGISRCHHPEHPMTRRQTVYWWKKIMEEARRIFGSFQSEGARDWSYPEQDRSYSLSATNDTKSPYVDEKVPLYQMVYHGYLIYNCFRSGINTFPGDEIYLQNIGFGGTPIVYYHQIHNPAWGAADGWSNDFTFGDKEKLEKDVGVIKRITQDVAKFTSLQAETMEAFIQHSPTLTETRFSGGKSVFVNYDEKTVVLKNKCIVPGRDFSVLASE